MKIYIKYMVSRRCKMHVVSALEKLHIKHGTINLGEVDLTTKATKEKIALLNQELLKCGLQIIEGPKSRLLEQIKVAVIEMVHYNDEPLAVKNSEYLSVKLDHDYTYLANIFSEAFGQTIEHYIIAQKIELVKELLLYDELSLTEISLRLNYSSVAYLSAQFKKVTGLTPSFFKKLKKFKKRIALEDV